jgi:formimidoylglutamate deiminase
MSEARALRFESALLPDGWRQSVRVEIAPSGDIVSVTPDAGGDAKGDEAVGGPAVPGMPNVHSHAFQRAMAGLAEAGAGGADFWAWREVMYRFANRMGPEALEAVAAQLFVEMLKAGYTAVGEFHYVHHQPDGSPYDEPARLSMSVLATASRVGIGLTHLPVLYARAGFGQTDARTEQRRFVNTVDGWRAIVTACSLVTREMPNARVGVALHSLRAVPRDMLHQALEGLDEAMPRHVHAAEQVGEVEECLAATGARPVAWLLDEVGVDGRWCLVHATHVDEAEVVALASSGAVVGLCPTTEANLGDGVFPLDAFVAAGGRFGIGSDSNVSVTPSAELCCLEYGQRLTTRQRVRAGGGEAAKRHAGAELWKAGLAGGAQALGRPIGAIAPGCRADLVVLDGAHPSLTGRVGDELIDSWLFASHESPVRHVMVGGEWVVRDGHHRFEAEILESYRETLAGLR